MDRDMVIYAIALAILGVLALVLGFQPAYAYSSSYEGDWLAPTGHSSAVTYYTWSEPFTYHSGWYEATYDWNYYPITHVYSYSPYTYGYYYTDFAPWWSYSPIGHSYYFWAF